MKLSALFTAAAVFVLLVIYGTSVVHVASGHWDTLYWLPLVYIPSWVALWAWSPAPGLRPRPPQESTLQMRFAGLGHALAHAGVMVWLTAVNAETEQSWLMLLAATAVLWCPVIVPGPANWIRVWNREQTQRLVAAEQDLAIARTRVLQSQMQPHFLFNALNSVTALMREDPSRAKTVLVSLKGLMERSLSTAQQTMSTVGDEVAFVRDQLAIEQERFHDRLTVRFDVDTSLLDVPIPPFSLQPLVENALRHGIARSIEGGEVIVRVASDRDDLALIVENTGAGLTPRWHEGLGLGNLRQRLQSSYGALATVTVESQGGRTVAAIRLPQGHRHRTTGA